MSKAEKKVGAESNCETCGNKIVCRMTTYKGDYENYPQWQNADESKAHFTSGGKCTCPQDKYAKTSTETIPVDATPDEFRFPEVNSKIHNQCWRFALREAEKVWPVNNKGGNLAGAEMKVDTNLINRMILAQVFYKKNMDYMIHRGGKVA